MKIKKLFLELDKELNALNDKEMGETGIYEEVIFPLRKLGARLGVTYFERYMVLGIKDTPVNPNDHISGYTDDENDNPYMFMSRESAQIFIDRIVKEGAMPDHYRIVELIVC